MNADPFRQSLAAEADISDKMTAELRTLTAALRDRNADPKRFDSLVSSATDPNADPSLPAILLRAAKCYEAQAAALRDFRHALLGAASIKATN